MQVRIDDDVIPLLEASKATHGGSLSKAANRLLRASAGKPKVFMDVQMGTSLGTTDQIAQGVKRSIPRARVGRCSHPILRRVGNACVVCGATIG